MRGGANWKINLLDVKISHFLQFSGFHYCSRVSLILFFFFKLNNIVPRLVNIHIDTKVCAVMPFCCCIFVYFLRIYYPITIFQYLKYLSNVKTLKINNNKSRYYSVQLGHLTVFENLMLKFRINF